MAVGLKVDLDALPLSVVQALKAGQVNLDDPAVTLALLKFNSVVGVTGFFDQAGNLRSMGIQCALCHSTVDNALAPGIGHRLDGWASRDLSLRSSPRFTSIQLAIPAPAPPAGSFDPAAAARGKALFLGSAGCAACHVPPLYTEPRWNMHTPQEIGIDDFQQGDERASQRTGP